MEYFQELFDSASESGGESVRDRVAADELLTVDELAAILKVPRSWIYQHTRKRGHERLPHLKLGKYLRFVESQVRSFLEQQVKRSRA